MTQGAQKVVSSVFFGRIVVVLVLPVILRDFVKDREKKLHTKKMKRLCLGSRALCGDVSPLLQTISFDNTCVSLHEVPGQHFGTSLSRKGHFVCI